MDVKLIEQANGVILQDNSVEDSNNCGTWSFEVAGQTLVCPIIVEDMVHPGQMLIEVRLEMRIYVYIYMMRLILIYCQCKESYTIV